MWTENQTTEKQQRAKIDNGELACQGWANQNLQKLYSKESSRAEPDKKEQPLNGICLIQFRPT